MDGIMEVRQSARSYCVKSFAGWVKLGCDSKWFIDAAFLMYF